MTLASARRRYVTDAVQTVNPHQLVVMLYDRLLLDITRAGEALETNNYEVVNENLTHAQDIVLELQNSLNVEVWSGGPVLMQLYTFLMSELVGANVAKDPVRIEECRKLVEPLADAWRNAAAQLSDGLAAPAAAPGQAQPQPGQTQPGQMQPGQAQPGQAQPGQVPPSRAAQAAQAIPPGSGQQQHTSAPPGGFVG